MAKKQNERGKIKMLKVKANELKQFVVKATVNATITDIKLDFKEDGLHVCSKDAPGVILVKGKLNKEVFAEYETLSINVSDSKKFIDALGTFNDNLINVVKKDNMVKLLDENGSFDLVEAEEVNSYKESIPTLEYEGTTGIKKTIIADIINKDAIIKTSAIVLDNTSNGLFLKIGEEVNKAETKTQTSISKEVKTKFQMSYFKLITNVMGNALEFSFGIEGTKPGKFSESEDKYEVEYLITPLRDEQ